MNPQTIAKEAAILYLNSIDPYSCHSHNIHTILRRIVVGITRHILFIEDNASGSSGKIFSDWRDFMPRSRRRRKKKKYHIYNIKTDTDLFLTTTDDEAELKVKYTEKNKDMGKRGNNMLVNIESVNDTILNFCPDNNDDITKVFEKYPQYHNIPVSQRNLPYLSKRSKARMEAFLWGCALAIPDDPLLLVNHTRRGKNTTRKITDSLKESLINVSNMMMKTRKTYSSMWGTKHNEVWTDISDFIDINRQHTFPFSFSSSFSRYSGNNISNVDSDTNLKKYFLHKDLHSFRTTYPQIDLGQLKLRLELYSRTLCRVQIGKLTPNPYPNEHECVLSIEPPRAMYARVRLLLQSFIATTGTVTSMRQVLSNLLVNLTKELLAVPVLGEDIHHAVRKVVLEYEHQTSFASLAFLSTPNESAETHLAPLVMKFLIYLTSECKRFVQSCKLERALQTVLDAETRRTFKTIEFRTIGHLLEVCDRYKDKLENIVLPLPEYEEDSYYNSDMFRQANTCIISDERGWELSGKESRKMRQAMCDIRRETIMVNGQLLPPVRNIEELFILLREILNSKKVKLKEKQVINKIQSKGGTKIEEAYISDDDYDRMTKGKCTIIINNNIELLSSGNEADTDGSMASYSDNNVIARRKAILSSGDMNDITLRNRREFNLNTVDIMTRRLLLAASRTGTGGDAYFVVRDLFGGDDVEVVPSHFYPDIPNYDWAGDDVRCSSGLIELVVRLSTIIIKCHAKFDVFPKPLLGECEPLIQLDTTSTEIIHLHEIRVNDFSEKTLGTESDTGVESNGLIKPTMLQLKERKAGTSGKRILSVRPAKYEKVEDLHTPS